MTHETTKGHETAKLLVCAIIFVSSCLRVFVHAETIDRVLAVAAGQIITLSDVNAARDLGIATPGAAADPVRAVLSQLIDRELVLAEVERYAPPEPAPDAV